VVSVETEVLDQGWDDEEDAGLVVPDGVPEVLLLS